jgi:hypothetical protein
LSPSKLQAPQQAKPNVAKTLQEGFESDLAFQAVLTDKLKLAEETYLNIQLTNLTKLKLDFDSIWELSQNAHSSCNSYMSQQYGPKK